MESVITQYNGSLPNESQEKSKEKSTKDNETNNMKVAKNQSLQTSVISAQPQENVEKFTNNTKMTQYVNDEVCKLQL